MRDRDAVRNRAIHEIAAILFGDALVRLIFPALASPQVDLREIEGPHVTAG